MRTWPWIKSESPPLTLSQQTWDLPGLNWLEDWLERLSFVLSVSVVIAPKPAVVEKPVLWWLMMWCGVWRETRWGRSDGDTCHSHCGQRPRSQPGRQHPGQPDLITYACDQARDVQRGLVARHWELLRLQKPPRVGHLYLKVVEALAGRAVPVTGGPGHSETVRSNVWHG